LPKEIANAAPSKKRKAVDINGGSDTSHDKPNTASTRSKGKHANGQPDDRPLKRKKSVTFSDGTKKQDGDENGKLLEDYVAQQEGKEDQFSKTEIAQFTVPAKVNPANQPLTKVNGKSEGDASGAKKKQKDRKHRADTSEQPQQDAPYITYLKEYHSSRATWKFSKNNQVKLLNSVFNLHRIPIELDDAVSSYLSGLQGEAARKRLAETAEKIIIETNDLEGAMPAPVNLSDAKDKAQRAQLKRTKSILRNQAAAETTYSDEHQAKLRKRKRAVLVLQSLDAYPSLSSDSSQGGNAIAVSQNNDDDLGGRPAMRKKTRRSRKMRTGVPDDDDTDETSSVSSVPSSTVSSSLSEDEHVSSSDDEEESGSSDSDSSSTASSTSETGSSDDSDASESDSETE
jgi:hypothetical protein